MQTIFEKIDKMFSAEDEKPKWAIEILDELKDIKELLQKNRINNIPANNNYSPKREFMEFINEFREDMKANVEKGIFPYIIYENRKIGVNFKGYLYDMSNGAKTLSANEAYKVYRYIYEKRPKKIV